MCGIVAIVGSTPVAERLIQALAALQHRGQDAAGVLTFDGRFHLHKGRGLATQVFADPGEVAQLTGTMGLGHVRYATQGSLDWLDAQPFAIRYPFGVGIVHNGNVVNFAALRTRIERERLLETSNDVELLVHVLIEHLASAVAELHLPAAFLEPVSPLTSWMSAIWMCESYQLWRCQMLSRL